MEFKSAIAVGLILVAGTLQAQPGNNQPFIAVHGEAKQEVVPDIFPVELTLKETSTDAAATQAKVETLAKDILAIIQRHKVADGDVDVSNLDVSPEYDYDEETDKQVFQGNTYERKIKVKFHSLPVLNDFISALPKSSALRIQTLRFETSRADELRRELLTSAIANARKTAETMAVGVGRKLGNVQNISNRGLNLQYSGSFDRVTVTGARSAAAYAPAPPPPPMVLKEGKITLDQDVYIVYSLD